MSTLEIVDLRPSNHHHRDVFNRIKAWSFQAVGSTLVVEDVGGEISGIIKTVRIEKGSGPRPLVITFVLDGYLVRVDDEFREATVIPTHSR